MSIYKGSQLISGVVPDMANQSLSNLNSTGQAIIDGKVDLDYSNANYQPVDKSGDTMTGSLTIETSDVYQFAITNKNITRSVAPSSTKYEYIRYLDKNGDVLGGYYYRQGTDGNVSIRQYCQTHDGSSNSIVSHGFDSSGNAYFSFPKCTTEATTTSTASSSLVAVIVQNYKSGASWYRVWSDGWIEQGGCVDKSSSGASSFTVSFLKSFADTNYFIAVTDRANDNDTGGYADQHVAVNGSSSSSYDFGLKKTGFRCSSSNATHKFNWYACGY